MPRIFLPTATLRVQDKEPRKIAVVIDNDAATEVIFLDDTVWTAPTPLDRTKITLDYGPIEEVEVSSNFKKAIVFSDTYAALRIENGNRTRAARRLGISRQTVNDRVNEAGWLAREFPPKVGRPDKT